MDKHLTLIGRVNQHGRGILEGIPGKEWQFDPNKSVLQDGTITSWNAWEVTYREGCSAEEYAKTSTNYKGD